MTVPHSELVTEFTSGAQSGSSNFMRVDEAKAAAEKALAVTGGGGE
jgi:hypothetical protein